MKASYFLGVEVTASKRALHRRARVPAAKACTQSRALSNHRHGEADLGGL
jgi:hypothetical protein